MMNKKINLRKMNIITSIIFIFLIIILILLSYNELLILEKKKPIFTKEEANKMSNIISFLLVIVSLLYVYNSYNEYSLRKESNDINALKSSFINLIINELQFVSAIVIALLPTFLPSETIEEETFLMP